MTYLDSRGEPVEVLLGSDVTHGLVWAGQNLEGWDDRVGDIYGPADEQEEPSPVQIHWPARRILVGYTRLSLVEREGYTGDLEVEMVWPAEFFEWEFRVGVSEETKETPEVAA